MTLTDITKNQVNAKSNLDISSSLCTTVLAESIWQTLKPRFEIHDTRLEILHVYSKFRLKM